MKIKFRHVFVNVLALLCVASSNLVAGESTAVETRIAEILARMPAQNATERDSLCAELLDLGQKAIESICALLVPPGTGDDSSVRYALSGITSYVGRLGAEVERKVCTKAFAKSLESAQNNEVKAFLIRLLQRVGGNESVAVLKKHLSDERLCEPATQALLAIGTPEAQKALLKILSKVRGTNSVTIIKALGELRTQAAAKKLIKYARDDDVNVRRAALSALANIGHPSAAEVLFDIPVLAPAYDRTIAPSLLLLYVGRLSESGHKAECINICRDLITFRTDPSENNIRTSALNTLVHVLGEDAMEDLVVAVEKDQKQVRVAALELANLIPGEKATARWIDVASESFPEVRAEIIAMLGCRGDRSALEFVRKSLQDEDREVRLAAIPASAQLGGTEVVSNLLSVMHKDDSDEVEATKQILLTLAPDKVLPVIADSLSSMPPHGRVALLEILAARRATESRQLVLEQTDEKNDMVRLAAIITLEHVTTAEELPRLIEILTTTNDSAEVTAAQNAVVASAKEIPEREDQADLLLATLSQTAGTKRIDILRPLARIGGAQALEAVAAATHSGDPEIQEAAIHALADWPDSTATAVLLTLADTSASRKYGVLALRGYVRLVDDAAFEPETKLKMLADAMTVAEKHGEEGTVLKGLAKVRTLESFEFVADYLDTGHRHEAARAAMEIALPSSAGGDGLVGRNVAEILCKASVILNSPVWRWRVENYLSTFLSQDEVTSLFDSAYMNKPPEGFIALFNGRDLTGWKGLVGNPITRSEMSAEELTDAQARADEEMRAHWTVEKGILVFDGHGSHLCTIRDYGDFELLVDWKIEPGGDSGIYLRGSPQVQIWDTAQWSEGSGGLYNNQKNPSKPLVCADNPIGQWNTFRIKMIGDRVTVHLNDTLVVDNVVLENYWDRSQPIFPTGQIELQSHGSKLYFRNIYIREIPREGEWRRLFNGVDLTGWTGATDSYRVEDSTIVCPEGGGGNLYTQDEFSDFILRFEFKLTPGANNGLGIRAPLEGDAAYVGMELQILDNSARMCRDLKPYQYHGSIYGIVPARRDHLRPVGEWNVQEVIANGRQITVNLNGVTIVDVDIDKASTPQTLDGQDHPGLKRDRGHIGFLGHGNRVEFRNIWIKELK